MTRDRVVVDANVLFSRFLHELIGRCGVFGIYNVFWSDELLAETELVLIREKGLSGKQAQATALLLRRAFPQNGIDLTGIDPAIVLSTYTTDPGDEHIVALAICADADILVTADRGFRGAELRDDHGVQLRQPDAYLTELLAADGATFRHLLAGWTSDRPDLSIDSLLASIARTGCTQFAAGAALLFDDHAPDNV